MNPDQQKPAEAQLAQLSHNEGFGVILATLMNSGTVDGVYRHLAALILKKYVKEHWDPDSPHFKPNVVSDHDKAQIRNLLPPLLSAENTKLQTAAAMTIAAMDGAVEYPERWPDLVENLIASVTTSNVQLVQGALRCLVMFAEDITDSQLANAIPVLFPALLQVFKNPVFQAKTQQRAIQVYRICSSSILTVADDDDGDANSYLKLLQKLLGPTLNDWLTLFQQILVNQQIGHALRLETVKALTTLTHHFPKMMASFLPAFLGPVWTTVVQCYASHVATVVNGDGEAEEEEFDDDGDAVSASSYISEVFDFFFELCAAPKSIKKLVLSKLPEIIFYVIGYMQMSQEDIDSCEDDPAAFIDFEDEMVQNYSARLAGSRLLQRFVDIFDLHAVKATIQAVNQRFQQVGSSGGEENSWKMREAAIFALSFIVEELTPECGFDMAGFLNGFLLPNLAAGCAAPLLKARAFAAVSSFAPIFQKSQDNQLISFVLQQVVQGLDGGQAMTIRLAACRSLGMLCGSLDKTYVAPAAAKALHSLCALLQQLVSDPVEGTLHTVLDTVLPAINVDPAAVAAIEADFTPLLLSAWAANKNDPLVTEGIVEVFEALVVAPNCLPSVTARTLPVVLSIMAEHSAHLSGTVEAALDLTKAIVMACHKAGCAVSVELLHQGLPAVLQLVLVTDDKSVMQSGTLCLTWYVRAATQQIAEASVNNTPMLQLLCQAVWKLLDPSLEDNCAHSVGGLVTQVVFRFSDKLGQDNIQQLVKAVVVRLHSSVFPPLTESLLLVFARLVNAHGPMVLGFLNSLGQLEVQRKVKNEVAPTLEVPYPTITWSQQPAQVHALQFVMQKWVMSQEDFHAPYPTKLSVTALCKVMEMPEMQSALHAISTQGYPIVDTSNSSRRQTRRSKAATLQYTELPLPSKIVSVLVKEWDEQDRSKKARENKEEEEEEEDTDDEEEDESPFAPADKVGEYINLSSLCDNSDDEADLLEEEYPEAMTDPINGIDLERFIWEFLHKFASSHGQFLQEAGKHLNSEEQQLLTRVMASQ
eukprot:CAMPEP_0175158070 /NCGR_PEP_ID=MMETSP0087-20121206/22595_1 /TAXON_ID=136419 /ORGANISM="Unknown Unknown, Strain D1" /LENGTH=1039 /DNA_ID=CAMNT_0016445833 /DNA_START=20 /DNA_END=3140 /DNA_ORIENTATION=+